MCHQHVSIYHYHFYIIIIIIICKGYAFYENHYIKRTGHSAPNGVVIVDCLLASNALYGLFMALIFYVKTDEAREEWYYLFFQRNQVVKKANDMKKRRSSRFSLRDSEISEFFHDTTARDESDSMPRSNSTSVSVNKEIEVSMSPLQSITSIGSV